LLDLISVFGSKQIPGDLKTTALADVIKGLAYLHSKGIVHGDVKPLNVLVSGEDENEFIFKVADYGCPFNNNSQQTSHEATYDTWVYASRTHTRQYQYDLETIQSFRHLFLYYSILPYELDHQQHAWENIHMALIESVKNGQQPVISSNVDTWLSNLIRECWLENPQNRPTAAAVSQTLEDYLALSDGDDTSVDKKESNHELAHCSRPSPPLHVVQQAHSQCPTIRPTSEMPQNNSQSPICESPQDKSMPEMQFSLTSPASRHSDPEDNFFEGLSLTT